MHFAFLASRLEAVQRLEHKRSFFCWTHCKTCDLVANTYFLSSIFHYLFGCRSSFMLFPWQEISMLSGEHSMLYSPADQNAEVLEERLRRAVMKEICAVHQKKR